MTHTMHTIKQLEERIYQLETQRAEMCKDMIALQRGRRLDRDERNDLLNLLALLLRETTTAQTVTTPTRVKASALLKENGIDLFPLRTVEPAVGKWGGS